MKRVLFKKLVGTGEIAQHEDLRSKPRTHIESQVWWHMLVIPALGSQGLVDPSVCQPARLVKSASFKTMKWPCLIKTRWMALRKDISG